MPHDYRNYSTDNAYSVFDADMYEFEQSRPVCKCCGEHITEEIGYYLNDEWYCSDCVRNAVEYFEE